MVISKRGYMEQKIIESVNRAIGDLVELAQLGNPKLWVDYDKEADVLYVSFGRPQKADDSRQDKEGIIRRKKNNKLIGFTILNASRFTKN